MGKLARALLAAGAVLLSSDALAWGFEAHRRLAAHAHEPLPAGSCLRAWLSQVTGQYAWQDKACDPDRWRGLDPESCDSRWQTPLTCEGPHHYLDLDYAQPISDFPRVWPEVEARFGGWAVANGRVPWRVEALYAELVGEFAAKDASAAIDTVAHLAHYVTDAHSPMHATKIQPGSCPACLHLRYETQMMSAGGNLAALEAAMSAHYGAVGRLSPKDAIFEGLLRGHPTSEVLIRTDAAQPGDLAALYAASSEATARQWGDSLTVLASLVGSAWVDAGAPLLPGMSSGCAASFPSTPMALAGTGADADAGIPPVEPHAPEAPAPGEVRSGSCAVAPGGAPFAIALALLALRPRRR